MEQGEYALSEREFARIKARVYSVAGISLSDAKRTLVVSRLSKILRALQLPSFDAYVDYLERGGSAKDGQDFVNALTTNLNLNLRDKLLSRVVEPARRRILGGRINLR